MRSSALPPFVFAFRALAFPAADAALVRADTPTDTITTGFTGVSTSATPASCTEITDGTTDNDLIDGVCKDLTLIFARGTFEDGNIGDVVGPPFANALVNMLGGAQVAVQGVNNYPADVVGFSLGEATLEA